LNNSIIIFFIYTKMRNTRKLIEKKYLSDKVVQNKETKSSERTYPVPSQSPVLEQELELEKEEKPKKQYEIFIDTLKVICSFPNKRHKGYSAICSSSVFDILHSPIWELNRKIDEKHVAHLFEAYETDIKNGNDPSFFDYIHIACNQRLDTIKVIEGQHRVQALEEIIRRYPSAHFDFPIILWLVCDDNDMMNLLHIVNNRKTFNLDTNVSYLLSDIMTAFSERFRYVDENDVEIEMFGNTRPYIDKSALIQKLKAQLDTLNRKYPSVEALIERFYEINKEIKDTPRYKRGGGSKITHDRAEKYNFFLGLDKEMEWFSRI